MSDVSESGWTVGVSVERTTAAQDPRIAEYTRVYQEHHARLVGYARSLTGNSWLAEDLVAEAHFRVWRRIAAGHRVDDPAAYLATTIRNLAATVGRAPRELPQQPDEAWRWADGTSAAATADPQQHVAYVDMLAEVMKQLPDRWAEALWLAEVEDLSVAKVGERMGSNANATAVLLHRAREGMRQAFLRSQPGAPADPACAQHWERMPAYVRGAAGPRSVATLAAHTTSCPDCRDRLAGLELANRRLPLLLGPALLALAGTGALRFLLPVLGGTATATAAGAAGAKAAAATGAKGAASAGRGSSGVTGPVGVTVAAACVVAAVAAIAFAVTGSDSPAPAHRALPASQAPSAPSLPQTAQPVSQAVPASSSPQPKASKSSAPRAVIAPYTSPPAANLTPTQAGAQVPSAAPTYPVTTSAPPPAVSPSPSPSATQTPPPVPTPSLSPSPSQSPTPSPEPTCIHFGNLVIVCLTVTAH
ncbi:MAG TPA: sigma-70 family RNA polymerase sigma factor [Actinocrinis sp.]|uniref:sigma-70 family RNA polymerase sigma factor n=1 Tax=Actinocrinis sp. TaxID=1920516 RepID=UPI002DDD198F|nr:sigma-70 family RNA polymerase sigma factor [Actinocrinis sp.]HEV2346302.1 sigma-70 family RNA polymerase sigma factor [Actinocrinis sp.]